MTGALVILNALLTLLAVSPIKERIRSDAPTHTYSPPPSPSPPPSLSCW